MSLVMEATDKNKTFVTILRDLVSEHKVDEIINFLYEYYYSFSKTHDSDAANIDKVRTLYIKAINDIVRLPAVVPTGVISIEWCDQKQELIDLTLDGQSLQFVDWAEIANSPVDIKYLLDEVRVVAYILHEITYWGFTAEEVKQAGDNLLADTEADHVEDIDTLFNYLTGEEAGPISTE